ncbi:vanadium-dependent haloperoxidase [Actinomadura monticuli]|uniref:Vanadium-dependent haloperoxidase n=1 Tax=Actinomadura monticuli TaxID=3097367 RepID=A0ABV4Q589_9ACTN
MSALCAAVLTAGAVSVAPAVGDRSSARAADFDFDKGNAITDVLWSRVGHVIRTEVSAKGNDATLVFRIAAMAAVAQFDAIAPYRDRAVGLYSDLGRRPASEGATNRNKNIAILYASYRVYQSLVPTASQQWREVLTGVGLDPDDDSEDITTPVGIGNKAGNAVVRGRLHDGMNQLGDEGGREYNRQPYADYLGFRPVNSAYKLTDPSHWQPAVVTKNNGIFQVQQFITPQLSVTKPFSYDSPKRFLPPPPVKSDYQHNEKGYKEQADVILAESAGLDDRKKMIAEFFDDKFRGIGYSIGTVALNKHATLDQFVEHTAATDVAGFDALITSWYAKYKYNAVRPFSAIRFLYRGKRVTAWGGPGKGTVDDIRGEEWQSYLDIPDHTEYPSGSTSVCASAAQAGRRVFGTDDITLSFRFAKGSSLTEPGVTPAADTVLTWNTWTEWVKQCAWSRVLGGVHFPAAVQASQEFGPKIGDRAYELIHAHAEGKARPIG